MVSELLETPATSVRGYDIDDANPFSTVENQNPDPKALATLRAPTISNFGSYKETNLDRRFARIEECLATRIHLAEDIVVEYRGEVDDVRLKFDGF